MKMKRSLGPISVNYSDTREDGNKHNGKARLTVIGIDMNCPLCGVMVPSGHTHECERDGAITIQRMKKL
jgi:hypothetical protein